MLRHLQNYTTNFDQVNLYAAFCVAFSAFLRPGEFTYMAKQLMTLDFTRWHIPWGSFNVDNAMTLTLPSSRTDPFHQGIHIHLPVTNDEVFPQAALLNLKRLHPGGNPSYSAPVFQCSHGGPFTREYFVDNVRHLLAKIGITRHASGHSFRRGAAISASRAGLSDHEIQVLGRW
jgi:hypothetical protein